MKASRRLLLAFIAGIAFTMTVLALSQSWLLRHYQLAIVDQSQLSTWQQDSAQLAQAQQLLLKHQQRLKSRLNSAKKPMPETYAAAYFDNSVVPIIILDQHADEYCQQQSELQALLNVLSGTQQGFKFDACLLRVKFELQSSISDHADGASDMIKDAMQQLRQKSQQALDGFFDRVLAPK